MNSHEQQTMVCPNCYNSSLFYIKGYASGTFSEFVDGNGCFKEEENAGIHDNLQYKHGKYYYCAACDKRIKKIENKDEYND